MSFKFTRLAIPEIILIEPLVYEDERGFITNTYRKKEFKDAGIEEEFVVDIQSRSNKGVMRGLHFQKYPFEYARIVRVNLGEVFDVMVDIRPKSPTFGQYITTTLSANNKKSIYTPKGFAHGFCAISDHAEILYKFSEYHSPDHDIGIIWNDPKININWPITNPILSKRDQSFPTLEEVMKKNL